MKTQTNVNALPSRKHEFDVGEFLGLMSKQMELAQALKAGKEQERINCHMTVIGLLGRRIPRRMMLRFIEG